MDIKAIKNNIAFTLAEMLVILTVFSVIAASTLPIMTAPQKLGNSSNSVSGETSQVEELWKIVLSDSMMLTVFPRIYYAPSSEFLDSTISVGMGPDLSLDSGILQPRLVVNKTHLLGTVLNASHIDFSGMGMNEFVLNDTLKPYPAGRISMIGRNIAIGYMSLWNTDSSTLHAIGTNNIAIGSRAMQRYPEMGDNISDESSPGYLTHSIAIGNAAFYGSKGAYSIAIGPSAGVKTFGARNIYLGRNAGFAEGIKTDNNSNTDSIFAGAFAGSSDYSALSNINFDAIAMGYRAGYNTFRQQGTIYIGYYAGSGNLANYCSLDIYDPKSQCAMIAIGSYAGSNLTGASLTTGANFKRNIYIGKGAGLNSHYDIGSKDSIFIGSYAGANSKFYGYIMNGLVSIGRYAGANLDNPVFNSGVIIGNYAASNVTGKSNTASYSTVIVGNHAQTSIEGEPASVVMGFYAGYGLKDASRSIIIGAHAGQKTSINTYRLINSICIGTETCQDQRNLYNVIRIGQLLPFLDDTNGMGGMYSSYIGNVLPRKSFYGSKYKDDDSHPVLVIAPNLYDDNNDDFVFSDSSILFHSAYIFARESSFRTLSDRRLKENIRPAVYSLKDLRKINVYEYKFKNDETKTPNIGVIAQELKKIIPEAVSVNPYNGYLSVDSSWIQYTLVNSVKEIDARLQKIQTTLISYTKEFMTLSKRVENLEKEVNSLERENRMLTSQVNAEYKKVKAAKR